MPSDPDEPDTKPEHRRISSQEFVATALREKLEHEVRLARLNGSDVVPAVYVEELLRLHELEANALKLIARQLAAQYVPMCSAPNCTTASTKIVPQSGIRYCDEHATPLAVDVRGAALLRRVLTL